MQSYNLKKLPLFVNGLVLFSLILNYCMRWFVHDAAIDFKIMGGRWLLYIVFYLCNYYYITPYVFKNGFSVFKILFHLMVFIVLYVGCIFLMLYYNYTWDVLNTSNVFELNLTDCLSIIQTGFFYFLFSTSTRGIHMYDTNKSKINDLTAQRNKIELENLQTNVGSDLISQYIAYLQKQNERSSISEEIVELSNFLRYTTYNNEGARVSYSSELKELKRYIKVLLNTNGPQVKLVNDITSNPLIPVFSLITPLKEVLSKVTNVDEVDVLIVSVGERVKMKVEFDDLQNNDFGFRLSKLNKEVSQLEIDII